MSEETVSVRVVRAVHSAASAATPRWLTGSDVTDACPDDKGDIVFATLSNLSKDGKGPLQKRRNQERGGVYEYAPIDEFDFDDWMDKRAARAAPKTSTAAQRPAQPDARQPPTASRGPVSSATVGNPKAQIVTLLITAKRRLMADEIFNLGRFTSMDALKIWLADLIKPEGGVLERERDEVGKPWRFGVRRDVDIEKWFHEQQGAALPAVGLTAYNAQQKTAAPPPGQRVSPQDAGQASAAAPQKKGGEPDVTAMDAASAGKRLRSGSEATPETAAPQAHPTGTASARPPAADAIDPVSKPAAAAVPVQQTALDAERSGDGHWSCHDTAHHLWCDRDGPGGFMGHTCKWIPHAPAAATRSVPPAAPADRKHRDPLDIMTELTIVAAANLAAAVRACDPERITSTLRNFERADRMREEIKAEARA